MTYVWIGFLLIVVKSRSFGLASSSSRVSNSSTILLNPSTIRTIDSIKIAGSNSKILIWTSSELQLNRSLNIATTSSLNKTLLQTSISISRTQSSVVNPTPATHTNPTPATHTNPTPSIHTKPTKTQPPVTNGFCARYTGAPCQDILNQSLTQFNKTERYFDAKHGINGSKLFLTLLLTESDKLISDIRCKFIIEVALCQYTLSPCMPNGEPVSFCREDCESLNRECSTPLNRLIGSAGLLTHIKGFDFSHLMLPTNCSIFASGKIGNKSCISLGLLDHSSKSTTASLLTQEILWIAVGAGVFLIIIVTILTVCCVKHRRKQTKKREDIETIKLRQMSTTSTNTMKERISQLLEMSLLSSKILEMYDPSKLRQFSLDHIEYLSDLGEGQFGLVFKGVALGIDESKDATERTIVAVKTLKKDSNEHCKEEFNQEVAFMSVLDHPNIVKMIAVATEEEPYCMIFEFMQFGDLNQFLRKIKPIDGDDEEPPEFELCLEDFLSICHQVASGMTYLASLHFVHRDLATRNCLVGKGLVVKIADFGLARDIYSSDYYKVRGDAMLPVRWMPPEAVLHGRFTVESDVYSYGVVMWEVFTYALQPYYGYSNEEVIAFVKQGVLLGQPESCPDHIYKLMLDCWLRTTEKRPTFTTITKRLVKDPPVLDYCTPRSLSVTVEEPLEYLPAVFDEEPVQSVPVAYAKNSKENLSVATEQSIERLPETADEPVMKTLSFSEQKKAENHYQTPGAMANTGFKSA